MSFISKSGVTKRLQIAEIELSGSPALNGFFTFNTLIEHNYDTAPTGLSSTTLTLVAGDYLVRTFLDITRSSNNDNYIFEIQGNGSAIGKGGRSGIANDIRADLAEATISSSSSISIQIKCTSIEGTAPTVTNGSRVFVWRVS